MSSDIKTCKAVETYSLHQNLRDNHCSESHAIDCLIISFAPWCPACQRVASVWTSLALKAEKLGINVAEVDTSKETGNVACLDKE